MTKVMPKNMQIKSISREINNRGIDPDTIDLESYVDGRLSYSENLQDIIEMLPHIKRTVTKNIGDSSNQNNINRLSKAQVIFELRKRRNQRMDSKKYAKRTFSISQLNKKNYKKWKNDINRYDIDGVDNEGQLY